MEKRNTLCWHLQVQQVLVLAPALWPSCQCDPSTGITHQNILRRAQVRPPMTPKYLATALRGAVLVGVALVQLATAQPDKCIKCEGSAFTYAGSTRFKCDKPVTCNSLFHKHPNCPNYLHKQYWTCDGCGESAFEPEQCLEIHRHTICPGAPE